MADSITIAKGRDGTVAIRCHVLNGRGGYVEAKASAAAVAGATSISIDRLEYTLASGDMLQIGDGLVVTLNGAHAIGATTLTVTSTPGPIKAGEVMRLLPDLSGYTIALRILADADDLVPIIPVANLPVTIPTQSTILNRGIFNVAVDAADTSSLTGGPFFATAWRTDAGQKRGLWVGMVGIMDEGGVLT